MRVLALIPARGGSKSIPRKNLLMMMGRPLLSWSIFHAQESKLINRVIVSTDDEEIADIACSWGAEVPFRRPTEFAGDMSPDIETFAHALRWLKQHESYEPDLVVHLRPTGPARRVDKIDEAIQKILERPEADSLRSVSLAEQTPYKMWFLRNDGFLSPVLTLLDDAESHSIPRQMLPKAYWQNGYVDIVRPNTILNKGSMVGHNSIPFIIDEQIRDVDYLDDLPRVEAELRRILENPENSESQNNLKDRFPV